MNFLETLTQSERDLFISLFTAVVGGLVGAYATSGLKHITERKDGRSNISLSTIVLMGALIFVVVFAGVMTFYKVRPDADQSAKNTNLNPYPRVEPAAKGPPAVQVEIVPASKPESQILPEPAADAARKPKLPKFAQAPRVDVPQVSERAPTPRPVPTPPVVEGSAAAQPDLPKVVVSPRFLRMPSNEESERYYPDRALRYEASGSAMLECRIGFDTTLSECVVVRESPAGCGFGEAAMGMSKFYRAVPGTIDGVPTASRHIVYEERFVTRDNAPDSRAGACAPRPRP